MRILKVDAASLLRGDELNFSINVDVQENIEALIGNHLQCLNAHYTERQTQDPNKHLCLVAIDEPNNLVIGYRYFYFEPGTKYCELFAVFIAVEHRHQGIAKNLFTKAIEVARSAGCAHFIVRFGSRTEERTGLVEYYKRYAAESDSLAFTIYYGTQLIKYPRPTGRCR